MKKIITIIAGSIVLTANAQVAISNNITSSVNAADQVMLYINNSNEASGVKGFGLPAVDSPANLPYTSPVPATKIQPLIGMLMFVKSTGEAMVFDGQYWSKAFNVEADNISRFKIDQVSTSNGQAPLSINSTIDKANYFADPLKLKTNVSQSDRLYIRQSGVYRISLDLVFTTSSPSSVSNRLGVKISVNGNGRFDLLENYANSAANTYMVSLDASVYVRQGDYISLSTVPDTSGTANFTITNASAVTVEKIL